MKLLVTVPRILDEVLCYCSHHFGLAVGYFSIIFSKIRGTMTNSLIQNNGNTNQKPDPK
jgi:hypothetical protein